MNVKRIAIDGGAATGKSTVSKLVAQLLEIRYINTGQMYRLFALAAMQNNIIDNEQAIYELIKDFAITYDKEGNIVSPDIQFDLETLDSKEVGQNASRVAALRLVREVATEKQIAIGREPGVLMEGRDIGTVIMKDADFKFFIKVRPEVAAQRRYDQHVSLGENVDYDEILSEVKERNERDVTREIAPLVPTTESIIIDSSDNTALEIAHMICEVINNG